MSDNSVLIVSATRAEARHIPADSRLLVTGIGKVRATMALARELTLARASDGTRVREVINIGTAGALHDHHAGLFLPSTVIEHDISATALRAMGYNLTDRWDLPKGDGTVLASGDTFVADPAHRAVLAADADLVDMEGCAIAHVSAEFGVPCRLVKVVTDAADEAAMQWPELVDTAARRLGDWLAARP